MPILWNLHLSDPNEDVENQLLKTNNDPNYDRLFKTKPLYTEIRLACKSFYAPNINISIDERMVASKARIGIKQYIKDKPTKWGCKLFVICDSKTRYTCDFIIYAGKSERVTDNGLTYDVVMQLMDLCLGKGYKLFVDNFYSSPTLFRDLYAQNTMACGTVRENRRGFPKTKENGIPRNAERGTIRWIRDRELGKLKLWAVNAKSSLEGEPLFDVTKVELHKYELYEELFSDTGDVDMEAFTPAALEMIVTGTVLILERQAKDQLEGGMFFGRSEELQNSAKNVPTTNTISERDFAILDILVRLKPAATCHAYETYLLWLNNKPSEWLDTMDVQQKNKLLDMARNHYPKNKREIFGKKG